MQLGERFDERETKTRSLVHALELAFDLLERPADARQILLRNTDAGVFHLQHERVAFVVRGNRDADPRPG